MARELTEYPVLKRNLEQAKTIDEVSEVYNFYEGIRRAARGKSREAEIEAAELAIQARRKLGKLIIEAGKAGALSKGGRPKNRGKKTAVTNPSLFSVGVDTNLAKSARQIGRLDDEQFGERMEAWQSSVKLNGARITATLPSPPKREPKIKANNITLKDWEELSSDERKELLHPPQNETQFNRQETSGIEWAQFSWNPMVGCKHDCPYCYARDITLRYPEAFPHGFEPVFRPHLLHAPANTAVPGDATFDIRFKNVFTGSMCDVFGRWVPKEWINAILGTVVGNPQWNFLFLTKFPKRMSEFAIPANAWMGTTVDKQLRVPNAENAFAKLKNAGHTGIRWLSCEPMLEPLKFERLNLFNWIVIGGASRSTETPAFHPPFDWIMDLYAAAKKAGCAVYFKTNLLGNRVLELPFNAPIKSDAKVAPDVFDYLGTKNLG